MPPQSSIPNPNEDRLLPPAQKSGAGPVVGIVIIIALLILGALYFWGARLNAQQNPENQLPLIPASDSNTTIISTTTLP
jgi:hypothetical protein